MNHAQKYLAQANRHIAELTVQIARQRVIVKGAFDTGQRSQAAPKIATNNRSPCTAARPQPSAASAESMTNSRTRGSIYRKLFISHLFWRRPDPPLSSTTGRDLSQ